LIRFRQFRKKKDKANVQQAEDITGTVSNEGTLSILRQHLERAQAGNKKERPKNKAWYGIKKNEASFAKNENTHI